MNKHTMANFNLHILEYPDSENLISCVLRTTHYAQKWIDFLLPEYNLNPFAGNSKGYKHTQESIEKMRYLALGRKHTEEVKKSMSENRSGINALW